MWLMVQFDLPMDSKPHRRTYAHFRKSLRRLGFAQFQKSIYARWEARDDTAATTTEHVVEELPSEGSVFLFRLTDRSMGNAGFYQNGAPVPPPQAPSEYLLC